MRKLGTGRFDLARGIGIGFAVGTVASVLLTANHRKMQKSRNHTIRTIGDAVCHVTDFLGF